MEGSAVRQLPVFATVERVSQTHTNAFYFVTTYTVNNATFRSDVVGLDGHVCVCGQTSQL